MEKRNIRIDLMFDGTRYHGFQRQNNGITIQECIETAIFEITGESSTLTGCGRTDAGVHARGFTANFFTSSQISCEKLPRALNSRMDTDIRIINAKEERGEFHARFSAKGKTYSYRIVNDTVLDVFLQRYSWFYPQKLNIEEMKRGAGHFIGTHDFTSFMAAGSHVKSTVRTICGLSVKNSGNIVDIEITADGFLYNMVRIIVGTLVYVGIGKLWEGDIPDIISAKKRENAGATAPAQGLTLNNVFY